MKALILAAGLGSRLLHKTKDKPKCLIEINYKPIIQFQLEALISNSINEIVIVTGYESSKIKTFVQSNPIFKNLEIEYVENTNYTATNSAYSFWLAHKKVKDCHYIHLNCDMLFDGGLIKKVISSHYDNLLVLDKKTKLGDNMEQVILDGNRIIKMDNKPFNGAVAKAVGVAKISPEATAWITNRIEQYFAQKDKKQNFYGIIREALNFYPFYGLDTADDFIFEVNTLADLEKVTNLVKKPK